MLKNYLKSLKSISKNFAKKNRIFDIVLYGSSVRSKQHPRDIDILLIFNQETLSERLDIAQDYKKLIPKSIGMMDIKTINIEELFNSSFFARTGVLVEGISIIKENSLSDIIGFSSHNLFTYDLKNLNSSQKTSFTYALSGRNTPGVIELTNSKHIGKGVVLVPIENSEIFKDFLDKWKIKYSQKKILLEK